MDMVQMGIYTTVTIAANAAIVTTGNIKTCTLSFFTAVRN